MRSLRTGITVSLISVNFIIIVIISLSTIFGFFQLSQQWEAGLRSDVLASLNNTVREEYPELTDIIELSSSELSRLSQEALKVHKGRLRAVSYFSAEGDHIYTYNVTDQFDADEPELLQFEIIRFISEIRHDLFKFEPKSAGVLSDGMENIIGNVMIRSTPFMGYKYMKSFDELITRSFLIGISIALLFSFPISILLSRTLSKNSRLFAKQLSKLADGERDINFSGGTTIEMQSSADAAESLQAQLKHNEEAQVRKLRDIVHDLKTPVAALGIQFEAINDGVLKIDDDRIALLSSEFSRIEDIIAELSRYTKLSSEDYVPDPVIFDMNTLIEEVIERFKLQSENKQQQLVFDRPVPPSMIEIDKLGIMRVMNNLTVNALKNAPEDSEIKLSIKRQERIITEDEIFIIEIENAGRINDPDLPLIFDRLYRSKRSDYHGSGLGLAISKAIVEKNGGKISAMNTAYNTVIFRVELPVMT